MHEIERAMRLSVMLLVLYFAGASITSAQVPRLTMIGLGAGTACENWMVAGQADEALEQWAFGFASAIAAGAQLQAGGDPLGAADAIAIHAWLEVYCRQHPSDALSVALIRLVFSGVR
jgi:hypothetical protein